jgi:hypothetical protein
MKKKTLSYNSLGINTKINRNNVLNINGMVNVNLQNTINEKDKLIY